MDKGHDAGAAKTGGERHGWHRAHSGCRSPLHHIPGEADEDFLKKVAHYLAPVVPGTGSDQDLLKAAAMAHSSSDFEEWEHGILASHDHAEEGSQQPEVAGSAHEGSISIYLKRHSWCGVRSRSGAQRRRGGSEPKEVFNHGLEPLGTSKDIIKGSSGEGEGLTGSASCFFVWFERPGALFEGGSK